MPRIKLLLQAALLVSLLVLVACRRKDPRSQAQRCLKMFHIENALVKMAAPPPRGEPIETDSVEFADLMLRAQAKPPVEFKRTKGYAGASWGMSAAQVLALHPGLKPFEIGLLDVVEIAGKRAARYFTFSNDRLVSADLCFFDEGRPEYVDRCQFDYAKVKKTLVDEYGGPWADLADPEDKVDPMLLTEWTTPSTSIGLECSRRLGKEVMLTVKYGSRDFTDFRLAEPAKRPLPSGRRRK